jgi:superoxide reductase
MMVELKELLQSADWKSEKHVPVIDAPDTLKKGEFAKTTVTVGKEIAHPNTIEHHIAWIEVYFLADGDKFPVEVGRFEFMAHGASTFTHSEATCSIKTDKPGTILASSYCNLHGLWQSSKKVELV